VTAVYRLNPEMSAFLSAKLMHIIVRGETVIGHYGRRGYLTGVLRGKVLTAKTRDDVQTGNLTVTFVEGFASFDGYFATVPPTRPRRRPVSGNRVPRRR
jgi:hypothetical protein